MNIAICDDEENIRIYIRKLIQKQETFCKITEFSSGKELLEFQDETNAEEIDILFLDISMGDEDGMTVAKQLRSQMESNFEQVFAQTIREYQYLMAKKKEKPKEVLVRNGNRTRSVSADDIYYIESSNRKVTLYLRHEKIEYYDKISSLESELKPDFFRIHKGYLVNIKYVERYDRTEVKMRNGDSLLISKYKYQDFVKRYLEYISEERELSQVTYEIIRKLFEIYPIILQIVLFLVLWNVFFRWEKGIWIVAGILAVMNICMGLWLEKPGVIRYTMSAVIVLGYCFCKYQKHLEKAVFILLLFYNFHALSYLIADSIYQCTVESIFRGLDVLSEEYIFRVYLGMAIGMGILLLSYTLVLLIMTGVVIKIVKKPFMLRWQETIFLSVLNIVGSMIVGISVDLSVVQIEGGVFLLYDDKQEMLWKLPIIVVLIYVGEISAIYIYQNYRKLQKERQKHFVEEQQVKAMKQRLEEAENFYGSIRRVRHEMKNHMTNIKGLVASEKYDEVENYIEKLDETIQTMDYKFNTGNAVTDVIINDKYQKAENAGISFQVKFNLGETDTISAFDIGIILNNLLDNAIEACEKLEQEQRYINLTLKKKNHFLLIEVENSFDGKVIWEDGGIVPMTTKQSDLPDILMEHGIGLKNVKNVADHYLGDMDIKIKNDVFKVTVML